MAIRRNGQGMAVREPYFRGSTAQGGHVVALNLSASDRQSARA